MADRKRVGCRFRAWRNYSWEMAYLFPNGLYGHVQKGLKKQIWSTWISWISYDTLQILDVWSWQSGFWDLSHYPSDVEHPAAASTLVVPRGASLHRHSDDTDVAQSMAQGGDQCTSGTRSMENSWRYIMKNHSKSICIYIYSTSIMKIKSTSYSLISHDVMKISMISCVQYHSIIWDFLMHHIKYQYNISSYSY